MEEEISFFSLATPRMWAMNPGFKKRRKASTSEVVLGSPMGPEFRVKALGREGEVPETENPIEVASSGKGVGLSGEKGKIGKMEILVFRKEMTLSLSKIKI